MLCKGGFSEIRPLDRKFLTTLSAACGSADEIGAGVGVVEDRAAACIVINEAAPNSSRGIY